MENCQKILEKANIYPKIQLAVKNEKGAIISTGPHKVVMLSDKIVDKRVDILATEKTPHIELTLEENGQKRSYYFPVHEDKENKVGVHYLVKKFGQIKNGDILIMECKRKGPHNYIDVVKVDETGEPIVEEYEEDIEPKETKAEDIPVVEETEGTKPTQEELDDMFGK